MLPANAAAITPIIAVEKAGRAVRFLWTTPPALLQILKILSTGARNGRSRGR